MTVTKLTTLCADAPAIDQNVITAFREGGNQINTCIAGMIDYLEEPLKSRFLEIKNKINTALAGLPATDAVPAANNANGLLNQLMYMFAHAQDMIGHLSTTAKESATLLRSTRASLPTEVAAEVTKAINTKVAAGDLVTKVDHETKLNGAVTAARQTFAAETAKVSQRRTALASANLPVPSDDVLVGDDAAYTAKETEAKARLEKLKPFKLAAQRLTTLAWNTDKATFDSIFDTLTESRSAQPGANAFVQGRETPGATIPAATDPSLLAACIA